VLLKDDIEVIQAATALLAEAKLAPELQNEALYYRAKAYLNQKAVKKAADDLKLLAKDTRTLYGAEAKYLSAQLMYNAGEYAAAEKEILNFIDQSTPHAYWLARSFILLSDVYVAMDKKLDARQYLLSLQQNYHADDDIERMIQERLEKLK
jgi:predicted Zn-dependent protease